MGVYVNLKSPPNTIYIHQFLKSFILTLVKMFRDILKELFLGKSVLKYTANLQENTHAEVYFNKVASEWVFSCKCTVYFQNTFS